VETIMADKIPTPTKRELQRLPDSPEIAMFLACAFQRLGGMLAISSDGKRYAGRPEPCFFRLEDKGLPQLPDSAPWEQFYAADEWRGALKFVDYFMARLSPADSDLIYDLFGTIAVDPRKFTPSIEEPRRSVQ